MHYVADSLVKRGVSVTLSQNCMVCWSHGQQYNNQWYTTERKGSTLHHKVGHRGFESL